MLFPGYPSNSDQETPTKLNIFLTIFEDDLTSKENTLVEF